MPLIKHFKSTSIWKAFILNSISATLIIFVALTVKSQFDEYKDKSDLSQVKVKITSKSIIFTLISTFLASMSAFTLMYLLFGFGSGMLSQGA